jgi:predicted RNase H-like nuclease
MIFRKVHMGKMSRKMAFFEKLASIPQFLAKVAIDKAPKVSASSKGLSISGEFNCLPTSPLIGV